MKLKWALSALLIAAACLTSCSRGQAGQMQPRQGSPTQAARTPGQSLQPIPPDAFLFIREGSVYQVRGEGQPERLAEGSGEKPILAAMMDQGSLLALLPNGIQRVSLADGRAEWVRRFDPPVMFGGLTWAVRPSSVIYWATSSDPNSETGFRSEVGFYNPQTGQAAQLTSLSKSARPLGVSAERDRLYVLLLGQDASYASIHWAPVEAPGQGGDLPVQGAAYASLSPDAQYIAVTDYRYDTENGSARGIVRLYKADDPPTALWEYAPPQKAQTLPNLLWSPDGLALYCLISEPKEEGGIQTSTTLWRLRLDGKTQVKVMEMAGSTLYHPFAIRPDGQTMLLVGESPDQAVEVRLKDGAYWQVKMGGAGMFVYR